MLFRSLFLRLEWWFVVPCVGYSALLLVLAPQHALAANLYWVGTDGANTGTASNWKTTDPASCGSGDASAVPGVADVAIFDADCDNGATINANLTVLRIDMKSGYAGTVTQAAGVSIVLDIGVTGDAFILAGGTFVGGDTLIDINDGNYNQSAGTFTNSSGGMSIEQSFTVSAGTFNNTGKTVTFDGTGSTDDTTLTCSSAIEGNVVINKTSSAGTTTLATDCTIQGSFTRTDGPIPNPLNPFILSIEKNFSQATTDTFGGSNLTIALRGTGHQTITQSSGTSSSLIIIAKPSGSASLTTNFQTQHLIMTGSTFDIAGKNLTVTSQFTVGTGTTFRLNGDETISGGPDHIHQSSTIYYDDPGGTTTLQDYSYKNLILGSTGSTVFKYPTATALSLSGSLTLSGGTLQVTSGQSLTLSGNWLKYGGSFSAGTGTVLLNGRIQTMTGSTTFYNLTKSLTATGSLTVAATATQTVSNTLTLNGAAGNLLSLRSSQTGTPWKINPQGTRAVSYVDVKDSTNTNATILACATGCTNSLNNTNWQFEFTAPSVSTLSPADNATDVSLTTNLVITFDETVVGGSGSVVIRKASDSSVVETIAATGALVSGSGTTIITIDPSVTLANSTSYYILIDPNAFQDVYGNDYIGISSQTTWNFTTIAGSSSSSSSSSVESGGTGGGRGSSITPANIEEARRAVAEHFNRQLEETDHLADTQPGDSPTLPQMLESRDQRKEERIQQLADRARNEQKLFAIINDMPVLYADVSTTAWYAPYVSFLIEEDIAEGYSDSDGNLTGTFGVANPVTLAEVLKMALEAAGHAPDPDSRPRTEPRNPSARGTWAAPYVLGAEDLEFSIFDQNPDVHVPATRGEVVQILLETMGIPTGAKVPSPFTDVPANHPYAPALTIAAVYGLIQGDTAPDGTLLGTVRPDDPINRAEVAKIVALLLEVTEK